MATYHLDEAFHVCDGDDEFDWPAGPVTPASDAEERVLAGMAARGHATLIDDDPPPGDAPAADDVMPEQPEPDPATSAGGED
jgi:hypothetical protein